MAETRMPTTLPSPADRGAFRFVAMDASGTLWRWVDEDVVWVREREGPRSEADDGDPRPTLH